MQELPSWLDKEAWAEFAEHRKQLRKPLTQLAVKKLLKVLETNKADHVQMIDNAIMNGWAGVFPLRKNTSIKAPQKGSLDDILFDSNEEIIDVE